jgi:lia operon protein LiaF
MQRIRTGQFLVGLLITLFGLSLLIGYYLHVDIWALFCPLVLILIGVYILVQPMLIKPTARRWQRYIGNIRIGRDPWQLEPLDLRTGVGDVLVDLTRAEVPDGEHGISIELLAGSVKVLVPQGLAVSASAHNWAGEITLLGRTRDGIFIDHSAVSPDYAQAAKRVRLDISLLAGEINVVRVD